MDLLNTSRPEVADTPELGVPGPLTVPVPVPVPVPVVLMLATLAML